MTGYIALDWPILAVSLFNTMLQLWLGLTILLNAEQRTWGVWLAGGGLLLGGLFFVSHTTILGLGLDYVGQSMEFWWQVGWIPVVAAPFAWYSVLLWYAGFWDTSHTRLYRRQRPWFMLTSLYIAGLISLLIFANPLPAYWRVAQLNLTATPSIAGIPLLIVAYPIYIILCISLSLDVLRRPEPSEHVMDNLARRRAHPWLVGASVVLLLVSLLVAWIMLWVVLNARTRSLYNLYVDMSLTVAWFDLVIASLIGLATVMIGQAVVSYEVFTGKTLPRGGLRQQWRRAIILAGGYGAVIGWSLAVQLQPMYALLLSTLLIVLFYALLSWRLYAERERYIAHLRPFVASQRLYDQLTTTAASAPIVDAVSPFQALCSDVLETNLAYLIALGPLAPLAGPPLTYPAGMPQPTFSIAAISPQLKTPQTMILALAAQDYGGAQWAIPLWSERGLIGVLLLGHKRDNKLFTQEEVEIARASGERLIDTQASAEMARRLMILQRQQLAQSQVLDRQTRRALHDDVLPLLHTAMLSLSNSHKASAADAVELLTNAHQQISNILRQIPAALAPKISGLGLINALKNMVKDELSNTFDEVSWHIEPGIEKKIKQIDALTTEVIFYAAREAIRNAARHARGEPATPLHLVITFAWCDAGPGITPVLKLTIEDNGLGLDAPGPAKGGSGQGLALHSTLMAVIGGSLTIDSVPNSYTRVLLSLPYSAPG